MPRGSVTVVGSNALQATLTRKNGRMYVKFSVSVPPNVVKSLIGGDVLFLEGEELYRAVKGKYVIKFLATDGGIQIIAAPRRPRRESKGEG